MNLVGNHQITARMDSKKFTENTWTLQVLEVTGSKAFSLRVQGIKVTDQTRGAPKHSKIEEL